MQVLDHVRAHWLDGDDGSAAAGSETAADSAADGGAETTPPARQLPLSLLSQRRMVSHVFGHAAAAALALRDWDKVRGL